jgi:uncharacterized protein (DUF2147 family)
MRTLLLPLVACCALAFFTALPVRAADGDVILGMWMTQPTDKGWAHVEIGKTGDHFHGTIIKLDAPNFPAGDPMAGQPKIDRENPEPSLQTRPIQGLRIMDGFTYAGDGVWEDGTIYDPETGKTYSCKMSLVGETLRVRGYIGISLLGRTTEWTRVPTS